MEQIFVYKNGTLEQAEGAVPREFPLKLTVNGREIVTLIASPHDLRFLVAGFLRLQGFVESLDDFLLLSVCEDFGIANVRVRKELPERLQPVLTSGCGAGITFTILALHEGVETHCNASLQVTPANLFAVMDELVRQAKGYRRHGGMHSAAAADSGAILLHAEDIGRHNTIDRLAGEALFQGVDLSGRVSSEMAAKAALLGVALIASRTSPIDMAVKICRSAGIALVGYLRGEIHPLCPS